VGQLLVAVDRAPARLVLETLCPELNRVRPRPQLLPPNGGDPAQLHTAPCLQRRDLLGGLIHEYEAV
jgi:hypothetical protein